MPAGRERSTVVVTGGSGFIGTHTVDAAIAEGYRVIVIDDLRHASDRPLDSAAELVTADIRSDSARAAIAAARPSAVLHLAAQGGVNRSWADPMNDASINVVGTLSILTACVDAGCGRVVFASSGGALYGDAPHIPSPEDTPKAPRSPYGTAKLAAEAYLGTWSRIRRLAGLALRYGNVYGPGQDGTGEAGVVAISCTRIVDGRAPIIRGDGGQSRDFVYVGDVAEANIRALTGDATGALNIGTGRETTVRAVVETICRLAGFAGTPESVPAPAGEVRKSCLTTQRARDALGWTATTELDHGLHSTWDHFRGATPH